MGLRPTNGDEKHAQRRNAGRMWRGSGVFFRGAVTARPMLEIRDESGTLPGGRAVEYRSFTVAAQFVAVRYVEVRYGTAR